jgi:hypothetical protein
VRLNDCRYFDIRIAEEKILVNRRKAQRSATHKISPQTTAVTSCLIRTNFDARSNPKPEHQNSPFLLKRIANLSPDQETNDLLNAYWQHKISPQETACRSFGTD